MRMLFTVTTDTEAGTRAIENGTAQRTLKEALDRLKPEAAYFYLQGGKRTTLFVLDLADPSEIIPLAEPLFSLLKAEVSLTPVMNVDALFEGFRALGTA
jgi:hypothetical protein